MAISNIFNKYIYYLYMLIYIHNWKKIIVHIFMFVYPSVTLIKGYTTRETKRARELTVVIEQVEHVYVYMYVGLTECNASFFAIDINSVSAAPWYLCTTKAYQSVIRLYFYNRQTFIATKLFIEY